MSHDAGGMVREWLSELVKTMLAPEKGLFEKADTHQLTYRIKESSGIMPQCVKLFNFLGMVTGKALFDRIPLNLCLAKPIFKYLAGETAKLEDIIYIDESVSQCFFFLIRGL